MQFPRFFAAVLLLIYVQVLSLDSNAEDYRVTVELDTSEVTQLADWGENAKSLILRWHPRITNLLASKNAEPPNQVTLRIRKTDKGVGATSGSKITLSSHWLEKHPDDVGLVIHELVHVIQNYPSGNPWWVTEGIADYVRWAIFEGKQQSWFPRPAEKQGYKKGYRVTAGFFLWLEADAAPGIVKKLNTAMRNGKYSPEIFEAETGKSLDELWQDYASAK